MRSLARLLVVLLLVSICVSLAFAADHLLIEDRIPWGLSVRCDGAHRVYTARDSQGVAVAVVPNDCPPIPGRSRCRNRVGAVIPCVEAVQ